MHTFSFFLNELFFKVSNLLKEPIVLFHGIDFLCLICLFEHFASHELVSSFVGDVHVSTSHGQTQISLLFLSLLSSGLLSKIL